MPYLLLVATLGCILGVTVFAVFVLISVVGPELDSVVVVRLRAAMVVMVATLSGALLFGTGLAAEGVPSFFPVSEAICREIVLLLRFSRFLCLLTWSGYVLCCHVVFSLTRRYSNTTFFYGGSS